MPKLTRTCRGSASPASSSHETPPPPARGRARAGLDPRRHGGSRHVQGCASASGGRTRRLRRVLDGRQRRRDPLQQAAGRRDVLCGPGPHLAGGRQRLRDPLGGARRDQQGRDQLRAEPRAELGRSHRLDAIHALDVGPLGNRRERGRRRRSEQPDGRDLQRSAVPRRLRRPVRHRPRGLLLQPRLLVRERGAGARQPLQPGRRRGHRLRRVPRPAEGPALLRP